MTRSAVVMAAARRSCNSRRLKTSPTRTLSMASGATRSAINVQTLRRNLRSVADSAGLDCCIVMGALDQSAYEWHACMAAGVVDHLQHLLGKRPEPNAELRDKATIVEEIGRVPLASSALPLEVDPGIG